MVNFLLNSDYVETDYFKDSSRDWILVVGLLIFLVAVAYPFIHIALVRRKYKKDSQNLESGNYELEKVVTYKVLVVDKYIDFVREGSIKQPKSRSAFFISFELENKKVRTYEVNERYFRRIKNGSKGELAVLDGKFIGFSKLK